MTTDVCAWASEIRHGEMAFLLSTPEDNMVNVLKTGLSDFGADYLHLCQSEASTMSEAHLVEILNEVRLSDFLLILTGDDKSHVSFNVEQCFTKMGGRGVKVFAA